MQSLSLALLLLEITGYAYVFYRLCSLPVVVAPAVYVSAVIICLYASDFLGLLWYARLVIHMAGWAAFLSLAWNCVSRRRRVQAGLQYDFQTTANCATFVLFAFLVLYGNKDLLFWKWDEFTHWGSVIKVIAEADTFRLKPNPLMFPDYPTATALFAYHVMGLTGFSEGMAIVSIDLILLAFLMPIISNAFAANRLFGTMTACLTYILMIVFSHGWDSVNIDHVVSVTLAGAIATYLSVGRRPAALFAVPLILAALALMKQAGVYLAVIAAVICSIDMMIRQFMSPAEGDAAVQGRRLRPLHIIWMISLFAAPLLMDASWKAYLRVNGIAPLWAKIGTAAPGIVNCCQTDREIRIANSYFAKYFGVANGEQVKGPILEIAKDKARKIQPSAEMPTIASSTVAVFGFLAISWLVLSWLLDKPVDRWRSTAMIVILSGGMVAYSASILSTYAYLFHIHDATTLVSFDRYHASYILAVFLIAFFWIGTIIAQRGMVFRWVAAALFAVWAYKFTYPAHASLAKYRPERAHNLVALRAHLESSIVEPALRQIPPDKRIYIGWLDGLGMEFTMLRYELLPRMTNSGCTSLVKAPPIPGIATCVYSEAEVSNILMSYDYFILGNGHARLKSDYPSLWDPSMTDKDILFRIDKSGPMVRLIPLAP